MIAFFMLLDKATDVVERREKLYCSFGSFDGGTVTAAIIDGHFIYVRQSRGCEPSLIRDHPSWEGNKEAKYAIGPHRCYLDSSWNLGMGSTCSPPRVS